MRNSYGSRQKCIFLEFNTVVGTDAIFHPDGRHDNYTTHIEIIDRAREIRRIRPNLKLVGYSKPGDYSGKVHPFPQYVLDMANAEPTE